LTKRLPSVGADDGGTVNLSTTAPATSNRLRGRFHFVLWLPTHKAYRHKAPIAQPIKEGGASADHRSRAAHFDQSRWSPYCHRQGSRLMASRNSAGPRLTPRRPSRVQGTGPTWTCGADSIREGGVRGIDRAWRLFVEIWLPLLKSAPDPVHALHPAIARPSNEIVRPPSVRSGRS